jgi:hypothetical protein
MLGFFNYNKPAVDILRDLIYASNGFMLPATGVLYGTPIAVTPLVADRYQRDSIVKVTMDPALPYQPWKGHRTFLYKRLNLGDVMPVAASSTPLSIASYPTNTYTLLALINEYYNMKLTQADVLNTTYTSIAGPFLITAAPGSLAFESSSSLSVTGYTQPPPSSGSDGSGSDGSGSGGSGSDGSGSGGSGSDGTGSDGSGSDGSGSDGSGGSGSDGSGGSGGGSSGAGTDGVDPTLGPDWEPNGESGAQDA